MSKDCDLVQILGSSLEDAEIVSGCFHVKADVSFSGASGIPFSVEDLMDGLDARGYYSEVNNSAPDTYIVSFTKEGGYDHA